jgi:hypothetical protein
VSFLSFVFLVFGLVSARAEERLQFRLQPFCIADKDTLRVHGLFRFEFGGVRHAAISHFDCHEGDCKGVWMDIVQGKMDSTGVLVMKDFKFEGESNGVITVQWGAYRKFEYDTRKDRVRLFYAAKDGKYEATASCR